MTRRPKTWESLWALTRYEQARQPYSVYSTKMVRPRWRRFVAASLYLCEYVYWQTIGRRRARRLRPKGWVS